MVNYSKQDSVANFTNDVNADVRGGASNVPGLVSGLVRAPARPRCTEAKRTGLAPGVWALAGPNGHRANLTDTNGHGGSLGTRAKTLHYNTPPHWEDAFFQCTQDET